jgi:hypothetical protein
VELVRQLLEPLFMVFSFFEPGEEVIRQIIHDFCGRQDRLARRR